MTAKTPTASGISRLLALAGFERSESSASRIKGWRSYSEGFSATKHWEAGVGDCVSVTYSRGYRPPSEADVIRTRMLADYIEAIRAADYSVKLDGDRLIVTAKPSAPLAAKEG